MLSAFMLDVSSLISRPGADIQRDGCKGSPARHAVRSASRAVMFRSRPRSAAFGFLLLEMNQRARAECRTAQLRGQLICIFLSRHLDQREGRRGTVQFDGRNTADVAAGFLDIPLDMMIRIVQIYLQHALSPAVVGNCDHGDFARCGPSRC